MKGGRSALLLELDMVRGNYKLVVAVLARDGSRLVSAGFQFTLYESDTDKMSKLVDQFKFGIGYSVPVAEGLGVFMVTPRLSPMSNEEAGALFETLSRSTR